MSGGRVARRFVRRRANVVWMVVLGVIVVSAVLAPLLAPYDPSAGSLGDAMQRPSSGHPLGTDGVGRDILSRLLFGGRVALLAATEAAVIAIVIGVPLGLVSGYVGGWLDRICMRIVEAVTSLPFLVVAIALIAITGPGLVKSMAVVGLIYSTLLMRLARGLTLAAREELYVDAAHVAGNSNRRIVVRHILPNIAPALVVQVTLMFATAIVAEATLSFLGLGVQRPTPSWGSMLAEAQTVARLDFYQAIPPGLAIVVTVLALNQIGDGLRDALARQSDSIRTARFRRSAATRDGRDPIDDASPNERGDAMDLQDGVLIVEDLRVRFPEPTGGSVEVVTGVSFSIGRGEIVGLVGESGSGKSATAMAVLGLVPKPGTVSARHILIAGEDVTTLAERRLRTVRGRRVGVVFQEPHASLNPAFTVGDQLVEVLRQHVAMSRSQARRRASELLEEVGIDHPEKRLDEYPHQFSGGMAQRVMIAIAIAGQPDVLIADEPTTALDVTIQTQILDLLVELRDRHGLSILVISHDLGVIADITDRTLVMYAGEIVETGTTTQVLSRPSHPYTAALIAAVPRNVARAGALVTIPGQVPAPMAWPDHCRFADRCESSHDECRLAPIELRRFTGGAARCVLVGVATESVAPDKQIATPIGGHGS